MVRLSLETFIAGPVQVCFDAARNLDLHQASMSGTEERAVSGKCTGLCETGDEVTWEAVHLGVRQRLSVRIGKMEPPFFFEDYMLKGAFKSMHHFHFFESVEGGTRMRDEFNFEAPFGILGQMVEVLFLKNYMKKVLETRNLFLRQFVENQMKGKVSS